MLLLTLMFNEVCQLLLLMLGMNPKGFITIFFGFQLMGKNQGLVMALMEIRGRLFNYLKTKMAMNLNLEAGHHHWFIIYFHHVQLQNLPFCQPCFLLWHPYHRLQFQQHLFLLMKAIYLKSFVTFFLRIWLIRALN